jgi:hypothetical protein
MLFGHHNNDATQPTPDPVVAPSAAPVLNPLAVDPTTGVSLPVAPEEPIQPEASTAATLPTETIAPSVAPADPAAGGLTLPPPPPPLPPVEPTTAPLPDIATSDPSADVLQPAAAEPSVAPADVELSMPEITPAAVETPAPEAVPDPGPEAVVPSEPEEPVEEPTMPYETDEPTHEPESPPAPPEPLPDDLLQLKQQALAQLTPLVDQLDQTPEEKFRTKMMMIQSTDDHTLIKDAYEAAQQITDEKSRAQALLDIVNEINYFTAPHNNDHPQV